MGQVKIREEGSAPSTPSEGVILYPTVATPSLLKLKDDAGNVYTLVLLEKSNAFTAGQVITIPSAAVIGLQVTPAANQSSDAIRVDSADCGSGAAGPFIAIGYNNNATSRAGWLRLFRKDGSTGDLWVDATGVLRIGAATGSGTDLGGAVVGAQTSSLDQKDVIEEFVNNDAALDVIANTPLFRFTYKDGRFDNQEFLGIVTDYSPVFGTDPDETHPRGRILNEINAHGYEMSAIKALYQRVLDLESKVAQLLQENG